MSRRPDTLATLAVAVALAAWAWLPVTRESRPDDAATRAEVIVSWTADDAPPGVSINGKTPADPGDTLRRAASALRARPGVRRHLTLRCPAGRTLGALAPAFTELLATAPDALTLEALDDAGGTADAARLKTAPGLPRAPEELHAEHLGAGRWSLDGTTRVVAEEEIPALLAARIAAAPAGSGVMVEVRLRPADRFADWVRVAPAFAGERVRGVIWRLAGDTPAQARTAKPARAASMRGPARPAVR